MKKIDCCLSFYTQELKVKVVSSGSFENDPKGFSRLQEWISRKRSPSLDLQVNMEATGVYHEEAAYFLYDQGYRLSVIQPVKGKQYAKSLWNSPEYGDSADVDHLIPGEVISLNEIDLANYYARCA